MQITLNLEKILGGVIVTVSATAIIASAKAISDVKILKENKIHVAKDLKDIKKDIRIIRADIKKLIKLNKE